MSTILTLPPFTGELPEEAAASSRVRFDPFRPLSKEERARQIASYERLLHARDGALDFANRRLEKREAFCRSVEEEPVRWQGELDRPGFFQHFRRSGRPPLDARTLWLVGLAKSNESESYGVEGEYRKFVRRGYDDLDPCQLYALIEEQYHSRLLVEACRTAGVDLELHPPNAVMRSLITAMQYLPDRFRYVFILAGELLGCILFKLLLERAHLFRDQPEVEQRLRALLQEILTDETFHVLYCRARLGGFGIRVARWLMPAMALAFARGVPQLRAIGCGPRELMARIRRGVEIPSDVGWNEPEPDPA